MDFWIIRESRDTRRKKWRLAMNEGRIVQIGQMGNSYFNFYVLIIFIFSTEYSTSESLWLTLISSWERIEISLIMPTCCHWSKITFFQTGACFDPHINLITKLHWLKPGPLEWSTAVFPPTFICWIESRFQSPRENVSPLNHFIPLGIYYFLNRTSFLNESCPKRML